MRSLWIIVLFAVCAASARAGDTPAGPTATAGVAAFPDSVAPPVAPEAPSSTARDRDPFRTPSRMRAEAGRRGAGEFQPLTSGDQVPRLTLRGFLEVAGKPAVALLEIEGAGVHMVRQGDTLTLRLGGRTPTLRIAKVDNVSVSVEVGTLAQVIVVR